MVDDRESGLIAEQRVIDSLYSRLDQLRNEASGRLADVRKQGPSGSPQNRSERDAFATLYEDRIAQLDAVEDRLCFGRLDMVGGEQFYVGRIGLSNQDHVSILTDWRAPAAQPFYAATAARPLNVVTRRHLTTQGRKVMAIEDDVLDVSKLPDLESAPQLAGEGALLAALNARRTGRMGDIVATIQSEQDAVIRAPLEGALVVQGGPGTGKTAVALHRAAFLLYSHREQLESSGVLIIGPSPTFLRYIDHVLPSLGETGAVSTTLAGLVGLKKVLPDHPAVARLKGDFSMAAVIRSAVRERQRVPQRDIEIRVGSSSAVIRRSDIKDAQARVRRDGKPHNQARNGFVKDMVKRITAQIVEQYDTTLEADDIREIERDVRDHKTVRITLNLSWMPLTPEQLLRDLLSKPHLLEHAAPRLSARERALLLRHHDAPFTDADVPLLDEAAELLGDMPAGPKPSDDGSAQAEIDYARDVISTFGGGGIVTAEMLAGRMKAGKRRLSLAERAAQDRSWTFGHVVVDEAQELSPMGWRMLTRRCPRRSFTIVGDVAQTSAAAGTRWWPETMDPIFKNKWTLRELTVSYRIPAGVAQAAQSFAKQAKLPVSNLNSARDLDNSVEVVQADNVVAAVESTVRNLVQDPNRRGALIGIVAPLDHHDSLSQINDLALETVTLYAPHEAKGLEFDVAIVVEPTEIAQQASDLYVALTRPTQLLVLCHSQGLPAGL